jgi:DNA modification methylase
MKPVYSDSWLELYGGDCREVMAELPAESAHCVVTSPPYWMLRDYGHPSQLGMEDTPEQYVETMVDTFRQVRRLMTPAATLWLNLGDTFAASGKGGG